MKKMFVVVGCIVLGCLLVEATTPLTPSPVLGVSAEEWAKLSPKERMMRKVGGMIQNKTTGVGFVVVINAQEKVDEEFLRVWADKLEDVSWLRVKYMKQEKITFDDLDAVIQKTRANRAVVVAELPGFPRVMVLPESRAVIVNVAALTVDGKIDKLNERVAKEVSRAFAYAFGVMMSERPGVLDEVGSLKELDELLVDIFTVDVVFAIEQVASKIGMRRFGRIIYRDACERGIAPAPKNIWQQRIYDAVRAQREAGAVNAIKIEYDPKKGK